MSSSIADGRAQPTRSQGAALPLFLSPMEAARQLSLSKWFVYKLLREKRIRSLRCGRRLLIPRSELERFAAQLERN
jgi:excisionase family DNA binding protein